MKIKVCGLTDPDNAAAIVAEGVEFVGFNFWEGSPRCVPLASLNSLAAAAGTAKKVGVFVNEEAERIAEIAAHLDYIQLHGDETPEFCAKVAALTGVPVVKALGVGAKPPRVSEFAGCAGFLFDTPTKGYGGSGEAFDWTLASVAPEGKFLWLAGGIGPENAASAACAARRIGAEALDLNSRVELRPGMKSAELVRQVIELVKHEV